MKNIKTDEGKKCSEKKGHYRNRNIRICEVEYKHIIIINKCIKRLYPSHFLFYLYKTAFTSEYNQRHFQTNIMSFLFILQFLFDICIYIYLDKSV